jgi:hypothetical protein
VPRPERRGVFGGSNAATLFETATARLQALGGEPFALDIEPFLEAAKLLYRGAWLIERTAAINEAIGGNRDMLYEITRRVMLGRRALSGDLSRTAISDAESGACYPIVAPFRTVLIHARRCSSTDRFTS